MARKKTSKLSRHTNRLIRRNRVSNAINILLTKHNVPDTTRPIKFKSILKKVFGINTTVKKIDEALNEVLSYYYKIEERYDYPEDY